MVLEIDSAARSHVKTYEALKVPELWQFSSTGLAIYVLLISRYKEVEESAIFPNLPIKELMPYCLEQSRTLGRTAVMRDFRQWVRSQYA
ncbi:MAG: hypothetical protein AAFV90_07120 [Cyanobacteria bacterium J06634_5]